MSKELIKFWVEALESGEYRQGFHSLKDAETGCHCALGLLVHLSPEHDLVHRTPNGKYIFCRNKQTLKFASHYIDDDLLEPEFQSMVVSWNDGEKLSFDEIAIRVRDRYLI